MNGLRRGLLASMASGGKLVLLQTIEFVNTNEQKTITPTADWANYDFLLFVPDLTVTRQDGQTDGQWLYFGATSARGTYGQYDGNASVGIRSIYDTVMMIKGWSIDRYYFRFTFIGTCRGANQMLKTVADYDSETFADLIYYYGGYRQGTYALLNGTLKIYGGKFPVQ